MRKIVRSLLWLGNQVLILGSYALIAAIIVAISIYLAYSLVLAAPTWQHHLVRDFIGDRVYHVSVDQRSGGTAFAVLAPSGKTFIVTNDHICAGSKDGIIFIWSDTEAPSEHKIIERSAVTDLCLIDAPSDVNGLLVADDAYYGERVQVLGHSELMALSLSNIGEIIQHQGVMLSGSADSDEAMVYDIAKCDIDDPKYHFLGFDGNATCGIYIPSAYNTSVLIQRGNSGSPLINMSGDVVGVVAGIDRYNWAIAVSLDDLKDFLKGR